MRKLFRRLTVAVILSFLLLPNAGVFARVGGSHFGGFGGGTHSFGGGTHTFSGGSRFFTGRHFFFFPFFGGRGSGTFTWIILLIVAGVLLYRWLQRQRVRRAQPGVTVDLTPEFDAEFSKLFYRAEDDWSRNDQEDLARVFAPGYMRQQRILLNGYARKHSYNRLTDVAIVGLQQEVTGDPQHIHVAVTAQMKDFFEYTDKDEQYNANLRDAATVQRFTEVWEMHRGDDGELLVDTVRQV